MKARKLGSLVGMSCLLSLLLSCLLLHLVSGSHDETVLRGIKRSSGGLISDLNVHSNEINVKRRLSMSMSGSGDKVKMDYSILIELTGQPGEVTKKTIKAVEKAIEKAYNDFEGDVEIKDVDLDVDSYISIASDQFIDDKDFGFVTRTFSWLFNIEAECDTICPEFLFDDQQGTTRRQLLEQDRRKLFNNGPYLPTSAEFIAVLNARRAGTKKSSRDLRRGIESFVAVANIEDSTCPADVTVLQGIVLLTVDADLTQVTDDELDVLAVSFLATYNELNFENATICDPSLRLMTASFVDLDYSDVVTTTARMLTNSIGTSTTTTTTSSSSQDATDPPLMTSVQRIGIQYTILCSGVSCDEGLFSPDNSSTRRMRQLLAGESLKNNESHPHHQGKFVLERPLSHDETSQQVQKIYNNKRLILPEPSVTTPRDISSLAVIINDDHRKLIGKELPSYPLCICPDGAEDRGPYNADFFVALSETIDILVLEGQLYSIQGLLASTGVEEVPCDAELVERQWIVKITILIPEGVTPSDAELQALADAYVDAYNIAQASTCDTFFRTTVSATVTDIVFLDNARKLETTDQTAISTDRDLQTVILVQVDIFIVIAGTCLGCPQDAPLTNDVSARALRENDYSELEFVTSNRLLQQELDDTCYCPLEPVILGPPSNDDVTDILNDILGDLIEDGVIQNITEVVDTEEVDDVPCEGDPTVIDSGILIEVAVDFFANTSAIPDDQVQAIADAYVDAYNIYQDGNETCDIYYRSISTMTELLRFDSGNIAKDEARSVSFIFSVTGICYGCPSDNFLESRPPSPERHRKLMPLPAVCTCPDGSTIEGPGEAEVFGVYESLFPGLFNSGAISEEIFFYPIDAYETGAK